MKETWTISSRINQTSLGISVTGTPRSVPLPLPPFDVNGRAVPAPDTFHVLATSSATSNQSISHPKPTHAECKTVRRPLDGQTISRNIPDTDTKFVKLQILITLAYVVTFWLLPHLLTFLKTRCHVSLFIFFSLVSFMPISLHLLRRCSRTRSRWSSEFGISALLFSSFFYFFSQNPVD